MPHGTLNAVMGRRVGGMRRLGVQWQGLTLLPRESCSAHAARLVLPAVDTFSSVFSPCFFFFCGGRHSTATHMVGQCGWGALPPAGARLKSGGGRPVLIRVARVIRCCVLTLCTDVLCTDPGPGLSATSRRSRCSGRYAALLPPSVCLIRETVFPYPPIPRLWSCVLVCFVSHRFE